MREAGLVYFYELAMHMKSDFSIFMDKLVGFALQLANATDEFETKTDKKKDDFNLDSDSEDGDIQP